jgi:hypothetical protein
MPRRPRPRRVARPPGWRPETRVKAAEVAALRGIEIDQARAGLEGTGASFTPSANDGYSSA